MNRNVITIYIPEREKLALKNYFATAKLETCSFQSASEALECSEWSNPVDCDQSLKHSD